MRSHSRQEERQRHIRDSFSQPLDCVVAGIKFSQPPHNLVAGKTLSPDNDSDDSESRTRTVSVLDAYESSVHGLSYAVSFVSILTILHEIWLADYGGRWARDHGPVITIILG